MDKKTRRKYSAEFKREAVVLASQPGQTITGVAADLGVGAGLISVGSESSLSTVDKPLLVRGVARDEEMMALG